MELAGIVSEQGSDILWVLYDPSSVNCIEDVEDLDLSPLPVPPPCWLLEERLGSVVGLQARLDANYQNWLAVTNVLWPESGCATRGEWKVKSGRQVDYLSVAHWLDQWLAQERGETEWSLRRVWRVLSIMDRSLRLIRGDKGKIDRSLSQIWTRQSRRTKVQGGHAECAACEAWDEVEGGEQKSSGKIEVK